MTELKTQSAVSTLVVDILTIKKSLLKQVGYRDYYNVLQVNDPNQVKIIASFDAETIGNYGTMYLGKSPQGLFITRLAPFETGVKVPLPQIFVV